MNLLLLRGQNNLQYHSELHEPKFALIMHIQCVGLTTRTHFAAFSHTERGTLGPSQDISFHARHVIQFFVLAFCATAFPSLFLTN